MQNLQRLVRDAFTDPNLRMLAEQIIAIEIHDHPSSANLTKRIVDLVDQTVDPQPTITEETTHDEE